MVKIQKLPSGQLVITIPKRLAEYEELVKGMEVEFRDIMIASICINRDIPLLKNNKKHFERLKGEGLKLFIN